MPRVRLRLSRGTCVSIRSRTPPSRSRRSRGGRMFSHNSIRRRRLWSMRSPHRPMPAASVWMPFALLVSLIAADNLLWRVASWIASYSFVRVTGDLRSELFRHLTGHAPSYFQDRMPGTLTSRITATSNAIYTIENMFIWNVLPPCVATHSAQSFLFSSSAFRWRRPWA